MMRFISIFIPGVILAFGAIIYFTWYQHAVAGTSPYDEIFIEINTYMPSAAREWACAQISERFPGTLPPHTCQPDFGA